MDQLPPLDSTFGAVFIGVILCAVLYGVSCAQVFYYFRRYSKRDGYGTKAVVVATLVLDTVHQALISHMIYTYTITNYFQPQLLGNLIWSPVIAALSGSIIALFVQIFYAVRVWKFSQGNVIITATLSVFITGQFVSSLVYVAKAIKITIVADVVKLLPLSVTVNVLAAASDVFITVVFCVLLRRARSKIRRSNTMINLLIIFTVQTGMLTSFCAVATLISSIASPDTFIYVTFYFLLSRLYCTSLLAALNVRDAIREKGHNSFGISLHPIDEPNSSGVANRREIEIKAEIADAKADGYITGVGGNGNSSFAPSTTHTRDPRTVSAWI